MAIPVVLALVLPTGLEQFEGPKSAALLIFGLVAGGLVVGHGGLPRPERSSLGPVDFATIALLLVELVTTAASDSPLLSIVGEPDRREGLLSSLALGGIFLAVRRATNEGSTAVRTLNVVLAGCAIPALYGLMQALRLDPVDWGTGSDYGGYLRPFGTCGHPSLLGIVTAMGTAIAVTGVAFLPRHRNLYGAAAILFATVTIATVSRAAWIAALLGGGVALGLGLRSSGIGKMRVRTVLVTIAALTASLGIAIAADPGHLVRSRLADLFEGFSGSGGTRRELWASAIAAWRASPWLGHGPDTFRLIFPRFQTPSYWLLEWGTSADQAHSIYLHVLATRGILGCLVGVFALASIPAAARTTWRARGESRAAGIAASSAILAAMCAGAFGELGTSGLLLLAVCAGVLGSLSAPRGSGSGSEARGGLRALAPAIALGGLSLYWSAMQTLAWHHIHDAMTTAERIGGLSAGDARGTLLLATTEARQAAVEMPADDAIQIHRAGILLLGRESAEDRAPMLDEAVAAARAAIERAPLRANAYRRLGAAFMELARAGRQDALGAGASAYERAIELAPFDALTMSEYEQYLLSLDKRAEAVRVAERAVAAYPTEGFVYWRLVQAFLAGGQTSDALEALKHASSLRWRTGSEEKAEARRVALAFRASAGK